jgi:hypothetical protein
MVQTRSKNYSSKLFFKITNLNEFHNGYQYKDGLNILDKPFEKEGSCVVGGLYFSDSMNIHDFSEYGCWIREITIPDDAQIVKDPAIYPIYPVKWRADKIILGKKWVLFSKDTISALSIKTSNSFFNNGLYNACLKGHLDGAKWCVENGATKLNHALEYACLNGHLECAKLCVEKGADEFNNALRCACDNGHLECAKFCVDGATQLNWALYFACKNGQLECAKLCVEKGANNLNDALRVSRKRGHLECAKFCVENGATNRS